MTSKLTVRSFFIMALLGLLGLAFWTLAADYTPDAELNRTAAYYAANTASETGTQMLVPIIMLFGAYVFVNGHLTPGGGFQGGAILASGMLLLLLANPARRFGHALIHRIESTSGFVYVAIGLAGVAFAGGFLDNRILPLGQFGSILSAGAIPLIYTLIGLKVGAEFSSILESLEETEDA